MDKIQRIHILGTPIDVLTMGQTLQHITSVIQEGKQLHHTVVNAGKLVSMQDNEELKNSVINADLINADGQAVVWAAKILGKSLPERVAGIDLMQNLIALAHEKQFKVFFFGAKEEVVRKVVDIYSSMYSPSIIAGYRNGYYSAEHEVEIAQQIADSGANMLFVAITSPKKENFLYRHREILKKVNFTMGVGGSFDVVSGLVKRAPVWMQKTGLEWLYRVIQEPGRMWKRYLFGNARFIMMVLKERFTSSN